MQPQEMSNTIWALATAGFAPEHTRAFDTTLVPASMRPTKEMILNDPITECFAVVANEAMRRPFDFKDQELKDVLWSFSKVRSLIFPFIFICMDIWLIIDPLNCRLEYVIQFCFKR